MSVTGIESSSARRRSLFTTRSRASLAEMSPVSSIVTCGWAARAASTESRKESIEMNRLTMPTTSAVCPSAEARISVRLPRPFRMRAATSSIAARNAESVTRIRSLCR